MPTITELKQQLRDAGLPVSGRKPELVDRLAAHARLVGGLAPGALNEAGAQGPVVDLGAMGMAGGQPMHEEEPAGATSMIQMASITASCMPPCKFVPMPQC